MEKYTEMTTLPAFVNYQAKDKETPPKDIKWSGDNAPPAIGDVIRVGMNGIGPATVVGYFVEHAWLGLLAVPHNPPAWYVKQNGADCAGHIFGVEFQPIEAGYVRPAPKVKKPRAPRRKLDYRSLVAAVAALPDTTKDIATYAPRVLAIFKGVDYDTWYRIDCEIGNGVDKYNGNGWQCRCVRNDRTWGKQLFDGLKR